MVNPTIIRGVMRKQIRRKSSEWTQKVDNMSFATSPRSFVVALESPPMMVGLTTKASSPTTSYFDTAPYSCLTALPRDAVGGG